MYTTINFKTKKSLKEAVSKWLLWKDAERTEKMFGNPNPTVGDIIESLRINGHPEITTKIKPVTIYAPGLGTPVRDGVELVEGPHYPAAHSWYAEVTMKDGIVVSVK